MDIVNKSFNDSEKVSSQHDIFNTRNTETELVNVNLIVENITANFNASLPENEKSKNNVKFWEEIPEFEESKHDSLFFVVMLCALLLNLSVIAAVFTQSGKGIVQCTHNVKKTKKRANKKQMLQTPRREKRRKQQILHDIINWQISLRRNTTVMYDVHTSSSGHVLPSTSHGSIALHQIAHGRNEAGDGGVQSQGLEVNPENQTQQGVATLNGFPERNPEMYSRNGDLQGRCEDGNVEARRFFSDPEMGSGALTTRSVFSASLPSRLHGNNASTSNEDINHHLPAIAEGENGQPPSRDVQSVQATEEQESHVTALATGETDSLAPGIGNTNSASLSVAPEMDGPSLTSTETLSSLFTSLSLSSVEEDETFRYEWIRLKTFTEWPLDSLFSTVLARAGWVSLGEGDRARCYSCHVVHEGWRPGDNPRHYHDHNCRYCIASSSVVIDL
jgi:hypothetical protein